MKKSIIFMLGLTSILTLTSCNGNPITPPEAKQLYAKMGETIKKDENLKELSTNTILRMEGVENGKSEVVEIEEKTDISLTKNYFHAWGKLNGEVVNDAYVYQKDQVYYTYDGLTSTKTTLTVTETEFITQMQQLWLENLNNLLDTGKGILETVVDITKEAIQKDAINSFGETAQVDIKKFDADLRSKNDTHLYGEYKIEVNIKNSNQEGSLDANQNVEFAILINDSLLDTVSFKVNVNQTLTQLGVVNKASTSIISTVNVKQKANIVYPN